MKWLVAAGIVYLTGIAIVLAVKPSFMFTDEGVWKEFGIGRNPNTHTWMPFWLFAILWALVSYIAVVLLFSIFGGKEGKGGKEKIEVIQTLEEVGPEDMDVEVVSKPKRRSRSSSLPGGYYVLNRKATEAAGGIPKYVYLGKGLPE